MKKLMTGIVMMLSAVLDGAAAQTAQENWLDDAGMPAAQNMRQSLLPYLDRGTEAFRKRFSAQVDAGEFCTLPLADQELYLILLINDDARDRFAEVLDVWQACDGDVREEDYFRNGVLTLGRMFAGELVVSDDQIDTYLGRPPGTAAEGALKDILDSLVHIEHQETLTAISALTRFEGDPYNQAVPARYRMLAQWILGYLYSEISDVSGVVNAYQVANRIAVGEGARLPVDVATAIFNIALVVIYDPASAEFDEATKARHASAATGLFDLIDEYYVLSGHSEQAFYSTYLRSLYHARARDFATCSSHMVKVFPDDPDVVPVEFRINLREVYAQCLIGEDRVDLAETIANEAIELQGGPDAPAINKPDSIYRFIKAKILFARGEHEAAFRMLDEYQRVSWRDTMERNMQLLVNQQLENIALIRQKASDQQIAEERGRQRIAIIMLGVMVGLLLLTGVIVLSAKNKSLRASREQAIKANEVKSDFLANMSHELRTPLNAIIGFAQMLESQVFGNQSDRSLEYIGHIRTSGRHLLGIINDVLDISKLAAGSMQVHPEEVDLMDLAHEAEIMATGGNPENEPALTYDDRLHRTIEADPRLMRQVLVNLISNAIKFSPAGSPVVVSLSDHAEGVCLSVKDRGRGMTKAELAKVMQPFEQANSVYVRAEGGTGLGLPIVKQITELHGGTLELTSAPGEGTTASIILPVSQPSEEVSPDAE